MTLWGRAAFRWLAPALAAAMLLPLAGCRTTGLQFVSDPRVTIVSPHEGATVATPLTLRWRTAPSSSPTEARRGYAVFVDRAPIAPDDDLNALADDACKARPGCPDISYLAQHSVYLTLSNHVLIPAVTQHSPSDMPGDRHVATIVVIDKSGRRIGESAWTVDFEVRAP